MKRLSRRDVLKAAGAGCLIAGGAPLSKAIGGFELPTPSGSMRCINIINFIRGVEPRFEVDLLWPVREQMKLILDRKLPATWLLQFDALAADKFVPFLKENMAETHEVGFWFEMNEKLCDAADVAWRGRPGFEWDSHPPVAFTIGYSPEERVKLADAAMKTFKSIWGRFPKSIASWNLDSITMLHLTEHYEIDAFAVCRDQIATDGFTIWGAPIAGYYPSKSNCWSPALAKSEQIQAPVFRMLGQDPVYYYYRNFRLPDGKVVSQPDTMEPVWVSGRSHRFVKDFLAMIAESPTLRFGYAQIGQENSFGWPDMAEAYPFQLDSLNELRNGGSVHVETMGETGRRFKAAFSSTPVQAQIQMNDPFGNTDPAERTIWYQSRFYRANLHLQGDLPFIRDITIYSDSNPQPFLTHATLEDNVEQRMPPVLDGYHWSTKPGSPKEIGAGGFFESDGRRLHLSGEPKIREEGSSLVTLLPLVGGGVLNVRFNEREIKFRLTPPKALALSFEWDPARAAFLGVNAGRASYRWQGFDYSIRILGTAEANTTGWSATGSDGEVGLQFAQPK